MNHKTIIPELRFQQFAGKWCLDQLDAVVDKKISYGIVQAGEHVENGMPYIKSQNLNTEINLHELQRTSDVIAKKYQRSEVKPGDIVFSLRGNIGISRIVPESIEVANLTQGTARISVSNLFYNRFINFSLQTNFIVKQVSEVSKGSTFQEISLEALRKIKIHIPTLPEQQKIASFLSAVDEKIQQLSRKKELLEQYKKGIMQQLFSGKLRFKDENGNDYADWEEKKLGDVFYVVRGNGISKDKLSQDGTSGCVLYGELYTKYKEVIFKVISRTDSTEGVLSNIGDLLIPSSTTTTGIDLANITALNEEKILLGGDITILRTKRDISNVFFAYYLTNYKKFEIAAFAQGSTIVHLSYNHFKVLMINFPSKEEQQKIANFLSSVDSKIESNNEQITQTQNFKRGLLQQLFV
jgi:type I restriction enzyme S subunit